MWLEGIGRCAAVISEVGVAERQENRSKDLCLTSTLAIRADTTADRGDNFLDTFARH